MHGPFCCGGLISSFCIPAVLYFVFMRDAPPWNSLNLLPPFCDLADSRVLKGVRWQVWGSFFAIVVIQPFLEITEPLVVSLSLMFHWSASMTCHFQCLLVSLAIACSGQALLVVHHYNIFNRDVINSYGHSSQTLQYCAHRDEWQLGMNG